MKPFPVYIGYDPNETVAYHVLAHSIMKRSSIPVAIIPLNKRNFSRAFFRPQEGNQSTEFSFSRFLVPYLQEYQGWALFMDCDMLMRADIAELVDHCSPRNDDYHVMCVKHPDYVSKVKTKFLGAVQQSFPRKNWSSVMLFNTKHCTNLTKDRVNFIDGPYLHRMSWCQDYEIGALDSAWNHLVGEYPSRYDAKVVHWTLGGPYFPAWDGCEYADEWWAELSEMNHATTSDLCNQILAARGRAPEGTREPDDDE